MGELGYRYRGSSDPEARRCPKGLAPDGLSSIRELAEHGGNRKDGRRLSPKLSKSPCTAAGADIRGIDRFADSPPLGANASGSRAGRSRSVTCEFGPAGGRIKIWTLGTASNLLLFNLMTYAAPTLLGPEDVATARLVSK